MIVEAHDKLKPVRRFDATRLVVYDAHYNPMAVFLQVTPNQVHIRTRNDPGFDEALRILGIKDTSIVETMPVGIPSFEV